jgi:hypothetical protein
VPQPTTLLRAPLPKKYRLKYTKLLFLSVVLYVHEIYCPALREKHRLKVCGNRVNIWTSNGVSDKRLKKLHGKELHNFYSLPSIIRMVGSRIR